MSELATRLWWIRHAPVDHGGRIYGQLDLSCDCSEAANFTGLAEQLPRRAVWVTSNLCRTHETAAAIVRGLACPGPKGFPAQRRLRSTISPSNILANGRASHMRSCTNSVAAIFIAFGTPLHMRRLRAAKAFLMLSIGYRGQSTNCSRCIRGATSSWSRMEAQSAPYWRWHFAWNPKRHSPLRLRIARSRVSTISRAQAWVTAGASSQSTAHPANRFCAFVGRG